MVVFRYGAGEYREGVANLLDPNASDRVPGEEVVVFPPQLDFVQGVGNWVEYSLAEAVRRWPAICYGERFRSTLTRNYFVCADSAEVEDVLLVQVDWDGDVSVKNVDLSGRVEGWRVDAKGAHQRVKGLISGAAAWGGRVNKERAGASNRRISNTNNGSVICRNRSPPQPTCCAPIGSTGFALVTNRWPPRSLGWPTDGFRTESFVVLVATALFQPIPAPR